MMNDKKIDELLSFWAQIYQENPYTDFYQENFYHNLIFWNVKSNDREIDLSMAKSNNNHNQIIAKNNYCHPMSVFNNWLQYYSNSSKTDCFIQPTWQYFCQFISKDYMAKIADNHMKIYIPLDANHIENGAKLIFDFLERERISHLSKIGKQIRFDNIVVRLINPDDTKKLLSFIKDNAYIQEGLIKANPFAFNYDGIAMVVDGSLSFNETISSLLKSYMDYKRSINDLKRVYANDFYQYIESLYINEFKYNHNALAKIFAWKTQEERKEYQELISLIIKIHNPNFTYNDYINHYYQCSNNSKLKMIKETNELLIEALQAMTIRFNQNGINQVYSFFITGNPTLITNRNNLRERMIKSNFCSNLSNILYENNTNFVNYAQGLLDLYEINLDDLVINDGKRI